MDNSSAQVGLIATYYSAMSQSLIMDTYREHLYRKHASTKYQCPRCLIEFETATGLFGHERSPTPCLIQTSDASKSGKIYAQQVNQLKRKSRHHSEEEKWHDIYRIVHRLDMTAEIPSPCNYSYNTMLQTVRLISVV